MVSLENPPENPCFGCGPGHRRGLRLSFEKRAAEDGTDEIVCEYTPKADEIGWPGLFHTGLLFLVMMETSYWTALTLGGRVMTLDGPATFEQRRLPRVGETFRTRARIAGRDEAGLRVACTTAREGGKQHGTLESTWRPASRSAVERSGITLPGYLLEEMEP